MIVGYAGAGALDEVVVGRLGAAFQVKRLADVGALQKQAGECDVLVVGSGAAAEFRECLARAGAETLLRNIKIVVDQTVADPESTRDLAAKLATRGVALVDAPIQCENAGTFPDASAVLCGGTADAIERVRALLDAMGAKVIHFGETGNGHAARLLVGAIAACNRMTTYECAAVGFKNGLSIADMALVLNRSSGANSATERVLPFLGGEQRTTNRPLAEVARELRLASRLAMRAGAPLMLGNLVGDLCQSLANQLESDATFDDAVELIEARAAVDFSGAAAR